MKTKTLIQNQALSEQTINYIRDDAALAQQQATPSESPIYSLALWNTQAIDQASGAGLWLDSDNQLSEFKGDWAQVPVVVIDFPVFTDGRGYSLAAQLRNQGFAGEIRAHGDIHRDQLYMLMRCGFNSFDMPEDCDLQSALAAFNDFNDDYQASANQAEPLYLRR